VRKNNKKNYASVINWIRSLATALRRKLIQGVHLVRASSHKLQAASHKLNQNLVQVLEVQGASLKPQAAGFKLQATSIKLHYILPLIKFYKVKGEGLN
jgi:hypothetical protein